MGTISYRSSDPPEKRQKALLQIRVAASVADFNKAMQSIARALSKTTRQIARLGRTLKRTLLWDSSIDTMDWDPNDRKRTCPPEPPGPYNWRTEKLPPTEWTL